VDPLLTSVPLEEDFSILVSVSASGSMGSPKFSFSLSHERMVLRAI